VLGASKAVEERDALGMAHRAIKAGARGVVFGRNVLQAESPEAFLQALASIVHDGVEPGDVTD
jgi:DhnA family fructose-bisphosphate aldolase class Ia